MLPEEGGYYRWVDRAFGRFWAFQNDWPTWMYSLVDMAIYPVLFNQYLRYFIPGINESEAVGFEIASSAYRNTGRGDCCRLRPVRANATSAQIPAPAFRFAAAAVADCGSDIRPRGSAATASCPKCSPSLWL